MRLFKKLVGSENPWLKNKKLIIIILMIGLMIIGFRAIVEQGIFEDRVYHYSGEFGNKGAPFNRENVTENNESNDYSMLVTYESIGAFMAGREIEISIEFHALNTSNINSSNRLFVVFPGAKNYPIPAEFMEKISDGYIKLGFINESVAYGNGSIIYYMPEYYKESIIIFGQHNYQVEKVLSNDTKYTYELVINGTLQPQEYVMRKNRFLSIAPLETYLQLKTNNTIIFLTFVAIILGIFQMFIKRE